MKDIKVSEVLSKEFERIYEDDPVSTVFGKLKSNEKDKTLVVFSKSNQYIGIITNKEMYRTNVSTESEKAKNIAVRVAKLDINESLPDAVKILLNTHVSKLPVFEKDKVVGVLTYDEVLKAVSKSKIGEYPVSKFYTSEPFIVDANDPISKVIHLFRARNISRAPVIESGKLQGIVSMRDIIARVNYPKQKQSVGAISGEKIDILENPVKGIMNKSLITAKDSELVKKVIDKMFQYNISGMPITENDVLKGIVTKSDLLEPVALLSREKEQKFFINAAGDLNKLDSFDKHKINKDLQNFMDRYDEWFSEGHMFVYFKEHKEKTRKQPYIFCKIRFATDRGTFSASDHDYGADQSLHRTLEHLERQIVSIKERKIQNKKDKRVKRRF